MALVRDNKLVERLRTLVPIDTFLSDNYSGVCGNGGTSGGGTTPGGSGSGPGSNGGVTPGEAGNGDDEGE